MPQNAPQHLKHTTTRLQRPVIKMSGRTSNCICTLNYYKNWTPLTSKSRLDCQTLLGLSKEYKLV